MRLAPRHRILRPLGAVVVAESQSDCHPTLHIGRPSNAGGDGAVPVVVIGVVDLQVEVPLLLRAVLFATILPGQLSSLPPGMLVSDRVVAVVVVLSG